MKKNDYLREALLMAQCAIEEGKNQKEVAEEFGVSSCTVRRRINSLASTRPKLYKKVINQWHKDRAYSSLIYF